MPVEFDDVTTTRAGIKPVTFPPSELSKIRRTWNSRISLSGIKDLAHQIASNPAGQMSPGHVRKGVGGAPELVAGHRRLAAIEFINANLETFRALYPHITGEFGFKAIYISCNEDEAIELNLSENLDRQGLSPIDKASTVRSLDNRGWERTKIARVMRCTVPYLSTLLSYLELPQEAQDALHAGDMTAGLARDLIGLPEAEIKATVKEVKAKTKSSAQASRDTKQKKRATGKKVARTLIEIREELAKLEEADLAFDLLNWIDGQGTMTLREIIDIYNLQLSEEERENRANGQEDNEVGPVRRTAKNVQVAAGGGR